MIICKKYDRGGKVKIVQNLLHLNPDGYFGPLTEEGVKAFQKENGLKADGIVGSATWSKLLSLVLKPKKRTISEIIVHCSATIKGKQYTVEDIRRWHKAQGWSDIGYHFVIYLDGTIHRGRPIEQIGAHCVGHNAHSIGVCYVGGLAVDGKTAEDTRTDNQKDSLKSLLSELRKQNPSAKIYGHRDFAKKDCPSFDARREYMNL